MTKGHDKGHKGQMSDRELMQQALVALDEGLTMKEWRELVAALRDRLAQPEQESVALEIVYETIIKWDEGGGKRSRRELARRITELYTAPPKREWAWLTDEEIVVCGGMDGADNWVFEFANALQIKLREKNCG